MARKDKLYNIWRLMRRRCNDVNSVDYHRYGGRGIKVYERWSEFKNFNEDMASEYKEGLTLDRIDNDGNYCKENCKWATRKEQANNRNNCRVITWKGLSMNLTQWAEYLGIKSSTLRQRFYVYKWDIEKCFTYNLT